MMEEAWHYFTIEAWFIVFNLLGLVVLAVLALCVGVVFASMTEHVPTLNDVFEEKKSVD
jgi:hypothetical protein